MDRRTRKRLILSGIALLVLAALVYGFLPEARTVDTALVERGPLQVTVEEEGETRLADTYIISSPVAAFVRRIDLEPGDLVEEGQPLVLLEPPRSAILDPRSETQAQARVAAAEAALSQARRNVEAAEAAALEAGEERDRTAEQANANVQSARAAVAAAEAELAAARAAVGRSFGGSTNQTVSDVLTSPISGQVVAVHRESAGLVQPGEPLVEVGNVNDLEIQ